MSSMSTMPRAPRPCRHRIVRRARLARCALAAAVVALTACLDPSGPRPTDPPRGDDPGIRLVEQDTTAVPLRDSCPAGEPLPPSDPLTLGLPVICRLDGGDADVPAAYRRLCTCLVR